MYNMYKRLKQRKAFINLDDDKKKEFNEDIAEVKMEMNEDFVDSIIDKIIFECMNNKIQSTLKSAKSEEELENLEIVIRIKDTSGRINSRNASEDTYYYQEFATLPNYFSSPNCIELNPYINEVIYLDQKLTKLFENKIMDRLSVYTNPNLDKKSSVTIETVKLPRLVTEKCIKIKGSIKDLIDIYYSELQAYNYRNRSEKESNYNKMDFHKAGRALKRY